MMEIIESGMAFRVDEKKTFLMEKSVFLDSINGKSKCEYITLSNEAELSIVEAKTSFSNSKNKNDFDANIQEIEKKFDDSILILNTVLLRHSEKIHEIGIPESFKKIDLRKVEYKLYLVIKNHQASWLASVSDDLKSKMKSIFKLWGIADSSLKVLNEDLARKVGLIK